MLYETLPLPVTLTSDMPHFSRQQTVRSSTPSCVSQKKYTELAASPIPSKRSLFIATKGLSSVARHVLAELKLSEKVLCLRESSPDEVKVSFCVPLFKVHLVHVII